MAAHVVQFQNYIFPLVQTINDNFADAVPRTIRLPGMSGGIDQFGVNPAPGEIGRVTITFILASSTREGMQTLRDQVRALSTIGKSYLRWTPAGSTVTRFCEARVNNISDSKNIAAHDDLQQNVTIDFQVSDPYWYDGVLSGSSYSGGQWGTGNWGAINWGPGESYDVLTGNLLLTIPILSGVGGNAPTPPIVTIKGDNVTYPKFEFIHDGVVKHTVQWMGVVDNFEYLIIDCRRMSVEYNGEDGYDRLVADNPAVWARFYPGANSIRFSNQTQNDNMTYAISYYNAYK
jgi:hypothetical protein